MASTRREFLRVLAGGALAPRMASSAGAAEGKNRPNILFIMSDDHAAPAIGCYGSWLAKVAKTPHIDRIAREGMRLDDCFCTNSICTPSRAAILTGQYSHRNGVYTLGDRFDGSRPHVAKELRKAGYRTAIIGKWHLHSEPTGFDDWIVLPGQGRYHDPVFIHKGGERRTHEGHATDVITDLSLAWLRARDPAKPFFLMCHHKIGRRDHEKLDGRGIFRAGKERGRRRPRSGSSRPSNAVSAEKGRSNDLSESRRPFKAPHRNWQPAPKYATLYEDVEIPEPPTLLDDYANRSRAAARATLKIGENMGRGDLKREKPKGLKGMALRRWAYPIYLKDYLRCVASIDEGVGRILECLDRAGLARNTLVIYTSDQGMFLGEHGYFDKRFMYEPSLRMPFLVRYPEEIPAGSTSDAMVLNIDFAPTFLDYAGVRAPASMQGRSFRSILGGRTPPDRRTSMYYRYWMHLAHHGVPAHYGIRTRRYKLIYYYGLPLGKRGAVKRPTAPEWELFDLREDPEEMRNLYADPAHAHTVGRLKAELARLRREVGDTETPFPGEGA